MKKGTYITWGKKFETVFFYSIYKTNEFLVENPNYGMIGYWGIEIHCARLEDKGK